MAGRHRSGHKDLAASRRVCSRCERRNGSVYVNTRFPAPRACPSPCRRSNRTGKKRSVCHEHFEKTNSVFPQILLISHLLSVTLMRENNLIRNRFIFNEIHGYREFVPELLL